jgi:WD40 repeat protein
VSSYNTVTSYSVTPTQSTLLNTWTFDTELNSNLTGLSPDGNSFYVTEQFDDGGFLVADLNLASGVATEIGLGEGVAVSPTGELAYLGDGGIVTTNPATGKSGFVIPTSSKYGAAETFYGLQWVPGAPARLSYYFEPPGAYAFLAVQPDPQTNPSADPIVVPSNYGMGGADSLVDSNAPFAWSGLGNSVAFFSTDQQYEILSTASVTSTTSGAAVELLTGLPGYGNFVAYSPDGKTIAVATQTNLYILPPSASVQDISTLTGLPVVGTNGLGLTFTPDSSYVVVTQSSDGINYQIAFLPVSNGAATGPLTFVTTQVGPYLTFEP